MVACGLYLVLPLFGRPLAFLCCLLFGTLISPTDPVAVLGFVVYRTLRNVDNYKVEELLRLALATRGSVLAAALDTSGPLAMVVAGGEARGRQISWQLRAALLRRPGKL